MIQSLLGLIVFLGIAWALSENRRAIRYRTVLVGIGLQVLLGVLLLKIPVFKDFFLSLNHVVQYLEESTRAGTSVVFGYLGGADLPFEEQSLGDSYIFAFRSLPLVLLISALSALLFYWGVLQVVVRTFSKGLQRTMRLGGAEGLGVATNIFLGMVESPLFIRPYLKQMTRSEIFTVMTCGMATVAGTVMVLYASILSDLIPGVVGHILVASIISAPAAVTVAKIMIPETGKLTTGELVAPDKMRSSMDAITKGTVQGVQLLLNIVAMIIVLVGLVHLVNLILGILPGQEPLTLQKIMGFIMAPVVWLMGVPWGEATVAGQFMGTKTVLNELIAYLDLSRIQPGTLSERSLLILTYAMCGFANPGSLGIMIGGMGTMAPERRDEIVAMGVRSIIAGTLATSMTGAVVGILG
jgi:CNT family concentrative nucleoside transporter